MKKTKVWKIEIYHRYKGWEVNVYFTGEEPTRGYCFTTVKSMMTFLNKKLNKQSI